MVERRAWGDSCLRLAWDGMAWRGILKVGGRYVMGNRNEKVLSRPTCASPPLLRESHGKEKGDGGSFVLLVIFGCIR
jgi:hypothetical protein